MKKLYIIRHAKAISIYKRVRDFDRPLEPAGEVEAEKMARYFSKHCATPELILTSSAKRAKQTGNIFAKILNYREDKILRDKNIYHGGVSALLDIFKNFDNSLSSVMLIGHNPTVHEIVNYLSSKPVDYFPTCCTVGIEFEILDWAKIKSNSGTIFFYETPK